MCIRDRRMKLSLVIVLTFNVNNITSTISSSACILVGGFYTIYFQGQSCKFLFLVKNMNTVTNDLLHIDVFNNNVI